MAESLLGFKSHIEGKNADVAIYPDRVEWTLEAIASKGKVALGAMTVGLSLLKTGIKGKQKGSEMIPIRSVSSVTTEKDGIRFTKVRITCSGNTIDFRVGHDEAQRIKDVLSSLILGTHPSQQPAPPPPPTTVEPDVADQIRKLGELRDAGLLSEEEFTAKKAQLLDRL